jgi:hypothetical protein
MPMSANQLAALVERAKLKAPPVVSPPPPPPTLQPKADRPASTVAVTPTVELQQAPLRASSTERDDFPTGWELKKESWHFHRRFFAIFKRPMACGEYSHLLWQIRRRTAEHLWEDCWRVELPGSDRTLPVRATRWQLITILPKHWQPPAPAE